MSHVTCHMSHVTCHMSHVTKGIKKVVKLDDGGCVINEAYPILFNKVWQIMFSFFQSTLKVEPHSFMHVVSGFVCEKINLRAL